MEYQIPGGPFINETTSNQYQIPGGPFINETSGAAPSAFPVLSAPTVTSITESTAVLSVTITFS